MSDERLEELAALYALDLLEDAELAHFETALAHDPQLQGFVRELRNTTAELAHAAPPARPPDALRARVLASIDRDTNVIRPPASVFGSYFPWMAAAALAIAAATLAALYGNARRQIDVLQRQQAVAQLALQTAQTALASERVVSDRQLATLSDAQRQLADATQRATGVDDQRRQTESQLTATRAQLAETQNQVGALRSELVARDVQVATMTRRIDALTGATQQAGRQLGEAKDQIAKLTRELQDQAALADLKITTLASMLKNTPEALAVAVWDPKKQEGLLKFAKLPALAANQDYQLWVVDPQYPNPVDGGILAVDPQTGEGTITFHPKQPVKTVGAFAVTRERKGGVPKAEGPFVLLGK